MKSPHAVPIESLAAVPGLAVLVVDPDRKIVLWSPAAAEIFGLAADEALGRLAEDVVGVPRTVTGLGRTDIRRMISEFGGWSGTVLCTRVDGTDVLLQSTAVQVPIGGQTVTVWLSHVPGPDSDAHQLAEAFAATAHERRRLAMVAEASKLFGSSLDLDVVLDRVATTVAEVVGDCCGINLVDESGEILVTRHLHHTDSQRGAAMAAGFVGRPTRIDEGETAEVYATGLPLLLQPYVSGRRSPRTTEGHQDVVDATGIRSLIMAPLIAGGTTFGILAVFRDVTTEPYDDTHVALCVDLAARGAQALHNALLMQQVVRADEDRADARDRLSRAERMEGLGRLAGGVAHDFNNLLGVISLSAQLAQRGAASDDPVAQSIEMILDATDRAASLTRQLLLFSRRQPGRRTTVDIRALLADLEQLLGRSIGDHVRLELRVGLGPLLVWADRTRLEQVLLNLAVNARDAMPDGGVLRITATWTPGPEPLDSSGATTDGWVRIAVTDTGVGMSDEVRAHAFEPFFTTKPVGVGTGLGLATVHGIVSELGGSLRIDSTPGAGTTISVEIPAVAASDAAPETPSPAAEQIDRDEAQRSAGEETVLVVEDEERLRAPLRLVLERSGFAVTLATDGADALDQLARGLAVDVVLTDVVMPRLTGLELADALATSRPALPVVFMSGYTDGQVSGSIDPARVVHKPFRASELLSALDRALASARRHLP